MPTPPLLAEAEIQAALRTLPGWRREGATLCRGLRFGSFARAFAFMTAVAEQAEALNHHPDWRNVYDRVDICLHTHDAGGLTALDVELARRISDLATRLGEEA